MDGGSHGDDCAKRERHGPGEALTRASMRALRPLTIQTPRFARADNTGDVIESKSHGANTLQTQNNYFATNLNE